MRIFFFLLNITFSNHLMFWNFNDLLFFVKVFLFLLQEIYACIVLLYIHVVSLHISLGQQWIFDFFKLLQDDELWILHTVRENKECIESSHVTIWKKIKYAFWIWFILDLEIGNKWIIYRIIIIFLDCVIKIHEFILHIIFYRYLVNLQKCCTKKSLHRCTIVLS